MRGTNAQLFTSPKKRAQGVSYHQSLINGINSNYGLDKYLTKLIMEKVQYEEVNMDELGMDFDDM